MSWSQSFNAEITEGCQVLVLGSMPGIASLEAHQYYAHPRNGFWPIMQSLLGIDLQQSYICRVEQLNQCGVGLWDVYGECYREGSLDASINKDTAQLNNFEQLFRNYPDIHTLAFNGQAAFKAYRQSVAALIHRDDITMLSLPSTSPAYAAMSLQDKTAKWHQLLRHLNRAELSNNVGL